MKGSVYRGFVVDNTVVPVQGTHLLFGWMVHAV